MKIRENKNLKYDKQPWSGDSEGYEKYDPEKCCLESFDPVDDKMVLYFKNGSKAVIKAINVEGGRELDLIESKLPEFIERSYEEILSANF